MNRSKFLSTAILGGTAAAAAGASQGLMDVDEGETVDAWSVTRELGGEEDYSGYYLDVKTGELWGDNGQGEWEYLENVLGDEDAEPTASGTFLVAYDHYEDQNVYDRNVNNLV